MDNELNESCVQCCGTNNEPHLKEYREHDEDDDEKDINDGNRLSKWKFTVQDVENAIKQAKTMKYNRDQFINNSDYNKLLKLVTELASSLSQVLPNKQSNVTPWEFNSNDSTDSMCNSSSLSSLNSLTEVDHFLKRESINHENLLRRSFVKTKKNQLVSRSLSVNLTDDDSYSQRHLQARNIIFSHNNFAPNLETRENLTEMLPLNTETSSGDSNDDSDKTLTGMVYSNQTNDAGSAIGRCFDTQQSTTRREDNMMTAEARRMRSLSVTLEKSNESSGRKRYLGKANSINILPSREPVEESPPQPSSSLPWIRTSMRLVRPFRLADPPSTSPALEEHRIFPCGVIELPSTPVSNRPRQYGRMGQRREQQSSRVESAQTFDQISSEPVAITVSNNIEREVDCASSEVTSTVNRHSARASSSTSPLRAYEMAQESESPIGQWSSGLSSMLACLGCTLGLFNISRFAMFSIYFGANFILQFLVLTLLIGIPLFTFHTSLGQLLGSGILDMWHISPIFKGIGISLLISQAIIGIYSVIGVSWLFVYLRDSFISKPDTYRWTEPLEFYSEEGIRLLKYGNVSYKLEQTIPDYFHGNVLHRRSILEKPEEDFIAIKFSVAFNLAIVWIVIFLSLSKGLKSYGRVIYVFSIVPIFGMFLLCSKMLAFIPATSKTMSLFPEADWNEFFLNSKSWVAAFTEVFLTWGVLGASAMQITSHNKQKHFLHRDVTVIIIITISVLLLSAFLASMCQQLLFAHGYIYLPSSFERPSTYKFLYNENVELPFSYSSTPIKWMQHSGLLLGERTLKPGTNINQESGYQVLRLATELIPATFAVIGPDTMSPFWAVLFYLVLILFGISQQLAIWHSVISGIITLNVKSLLPCQTTIAWFVCVSSFSFGLPMTTEMGIFVVYFMDYVIGCGWWIMVLYLLEMVSIFMVRGRPYTGETIAATLFTRCGNMIQNWIAPALSFNWNIVLPVTLFLLSTSVFKNGNYRVLYNTHNVKFYEYWAQWSRKLGCFMQLSPLFLVPLVAIIQCYRYLTTGPPDLFDRIQLLYRPIMRNNRVLRDLENQTTADSNRNGNTTNSVSDDPPPKYTPPPSYSTATGTRIAKLLRQSFRRSVRRMAFALGNVDIPSTSSEQRRLPPPDYSAVLVEINQTDGSVAACSSSTAVVEIEDTNTRSDNNITIISSLRNNNNNLSEQECNSIQCLVESAAPINQDSIIVVDDIKNNS